MLQLYFESLFLSPTFVILCPLQEALRPTIILQALTEITAAIASKTEKQVHKKMRF